MHPSFETRQFHCYPRVFLLSGPMQKNKRGKEFFFCVYTCVSKTKTFIYKFSALLRFYAHRPSGCRLWTCRQALSTCRHAKPPVPSFLHKTHCVQKKNACEKIFNVCMCVCQVYMCVCPFADVNPLSQGIDLRFTEDTSFLLCSYHSSLEVLQTRASFLYHFLKFAEQSFLPLS